MAELYPLLKYLHVGCVGLSAFGFFARGILLLKNSRLMQGRWLRVLPHVNDSLLLAAAIGLATISGQYPFVAAWLSAKVLGLCVYIGLGSFALGSAPGRSRVARAAAFCAALLVFGWIVSVALSRNPAGMLRAH